MDRWMDGFRGVAITDLYRVYFVFDPGGMHQLCWAHQLRRARHDADASGDPDVRRLRDDMNGMFASALDCMSHSALLRHRMEYMLDAVLEPYRTICRGSVNKRLAGLVSYTEMGLHGLFTFLEHPGVDPTNNTAERALRYVVVFRKISGQLKGGRRREAYVKLCDMRADMEAPRQVRGPGGGKAGLGGGDFIRLNTKIRPCL